ncbi:hypothetical protein DIC66_13375 [Rhodoferax lacus]|uniref:Type I secretion protein TolC n=1 Tax=Rhodoferax lacus TaxID=2184758 RepID=A0A3E1RAA4_9BURK|nr:TolC family protein [Rhodoferax lacus]RFO96298.1 hypothetical protein DIC66_13375 [Rhodoferax lacus]
MTKTRDLRVLLATLLVLNVWSPCIAQSLPELIDSILISHPSVRSQRALGESAKEAVQGAEWQFYPTPSIGFEQVDASRLDPNYPSFGDKNVTTLRLQQPLWTGGRLTAGLDRAKAAVVASQATLDSVRQDLALRVVQFYADWLGALLKRQAYEKSLKAHRTLQDQINRRIAGGVSPQSDLTLLLGRAQQTEADLSTAQAQEQSALGRLSQLLGHSLQARDMAATLSTPQAIAASAQELLEQAQAQNPGVIKLQAQAQIAEAEVTSAKADLKPEVYLRAESQYGSYATPGTPTLNRYFVGFSSRFGAGLSTLSQVSGAEARYQAALADIDSTRLSLGEQIQSDYAQAATGQLRLMALQASLESADNITRAWNRQFVAGRKTWTDVMNAARELAQLEAQIGDAKAAQLLVTWRMAIVGRGVDDVLIAALSSGAVVATPSPVRMRAAEPDESVVTLAAGVETEIPLYAQGEADAILLRMAPSIDPLNFGVGVGASDITHPLKNSEGLW